MTSHFGQARRSLRISHLKKRRQLQSETLEERRLLFADAMHSQLIAGQTTGGVQTGGLPLNEEARALLKSASSAISESNNDQEAQKDYNHFFGSAFSTSAQQINRLYVEAVEAADPDLFSNPSIKNERLATIAQNFGRILHAAQDFYAHTNWMDLIQGGALPSTSLIDTGLSYWDNLTPYSVVSNAPTTIAGQSYAGVMLIEDDSFFESVGKSITPAGDVTGHAKPVHPSLKLASVEVGNQKFLGVVSGTFLLLPDHTPDGAAYSFSELDKSPTTAALHLQAKEAAARQTEHELIRLISLVRQRWGTYQHLLDAWVAGDKQPAVIAELNNRTTEGRSLEAVAAQVKSGNITNVTVVTHGFQLSEGNGDSLLSLAQAIQYRTGGWLIDYDVPAENQRGFYQLSELPTRLADHDGNGVADGHAVLLFDWAAESNNLSSGWTEAAGDALFAMLNRLGLADPMRGANQSVKLHFIAHSFGSAVTSEAVERLGRFGVQVDQVTFLDPHDFDQQLIPVDGDQNQSSLNLPEGYGAAVWSNVAFADVYYQANLIGPPNGRPILGATNYNVSNDLLVSGPSSHSDVWSELYRGTVINPGLRNFGYQFSTADSKLRQQSGLSTITRPQPRFFDDSQDHRHTDPSLLYAVRLHADVAPPSSIALSDDVKFTLRLWDLQGTQFTYSIQVTQAATSSNGQVEHLAEDVQDAVAAALSGSKFSGKTLVTVKDGRLVLYAKGDTVKSLQVVDQAGADFLKLSALGFTSSQQADKDPFFDDYRAPIQWTNTIYNGDFQVGGNEHIGESMIPGWSQHFGGGPSEQVATQSGNNFIALDEDARSRTHNAFYLDPQYKILTFDMRVTTADRSDRLAVYIGNRLVQAYDVDTVGDFQTIKFAIPDDLLGTTQTLTFRLVHGFYSIELEADPPASFAFTNDVRFQLELTDKSGVLQEYTVALPKVVTSNNVTINDLAGDLSEAIDAALSGTKFYQKVTAVARKDISGQNVLAILAQGDVIDKVFLDDLSGNGFQKLSALGFFDGQEEHAENLDARVLIDNVNVEIGSHTGDLLEVDLKRLYPQDTAFGVISWDYLNTPNPSGYRRLEVRENQLRGDHQLGTTVGLNEAFVIFSDQIDRVGDTYGQPFSSTGRFVLAPPTLDGISGDTDDATHGFSGQLRLSYRVGETPLAQILLSSTNQASVMAALQAETGWQATLNANWQQDATAAKPFQLPASAKKASTPIFKGDSNEVVTEQWLIRADGQEFALIARQDRLDLYLVRTVTFSVLPGLTVAQVDDQNVRVNAATRLEVARMQQRLRYFDYPDEFGNLLVVDGIVGPHTRHATGLFIASSTGTEFEVATSLDENAIVYANAINGPRWTSLDDLPSADFQTKTGPQQPGLVRLHATSWLTETIQNAAKAAKQAGSTTPVGSTIIVEALSASWGGDTFANVIGRRANPTLVTPNNNLSGAKLLVRVNGVLQTSVSFTGTESSAAQIISRINASSVGFKALKVPDQNLDYIRLVANDPTHSLTVEAVDPNNLSDERSRQLLIALGFSLPYAHDAHRQGLAVDFDIHTWSLADIKSWVRALEGHAYAGVTLAEVLAPTQAAVDAINAGRSIPLAKLDSSLSGLLHVEISPPPAITSVEPDPVVTQDIKNAFDEVFNWLDKLIDVELDKQLPALVEAKPGATGSSGQPSDETEQKPATMASSLNLLDVIKNVKNNPEKKSTFDLIKDAYDDVTKADVYGLAERLTRTEVDFYLNLPTGGPTQSFPLEDGTSISYQHSRVQISIYDAIGNEYQASVFFEKATAANVWNVHVVQHAKDGSGQSIITTGRRLGEMKQITFDPITGTIKSGTPSALVFGGFQPTAEVKPVDVRLYFTDATNRQAEPFKSGWTAWGTASNVLYNKKTGQVDLYLRVIGDGNTGDRKFDFTEQMDDLGSDLPDVLSASVGLDALLDFKVGWNIKSSKPLAETITLTLNDFSANFDLLVDTIQTDLTSKLGWLEAKIVDTPTHNSYITGGAGFDVILNNDLPITVASLKTVEVGKEIKIDIDCNLDGVLFFESNVGGHPIPGSLWMTLGLYSTQLVAANPPVSTANYAQDTSFSLALTDGAGVPQTFSVTLSGLATSGNGSLVDLAADLENAIENSLAGSKFAGKVSVVAIGDKLAIVGHGTGITKLAVDDLTGNGFFKLAQLGFDSGQEVTAPPKLKIQPKGDLVDLIDKLKSWR